MVSATASTPETCAYCDASVDGETDYRRHLRDAHDPWELSPIDRRRADSYRPDPNAAVRVGSDLADVLAELRYPVDAATGVKYAVYAFSASLLVAAVLGAGL